VLLEIKVVLPASKVFLTSFTGALETGGRAALLPGQIGHYFKNDKLRCIMTYIVVGLSVTSLVRTTDV